MEVRLGLVRGAARAAVFDWLISITVTLQGRKGKLRATGNKPLDYVSHDQDQDEPHRVNTHILINYQLSQLHFSF